MKSSGLLKLAIGAVVVFIIYAVSQSTGGEGRSNAERSLDIKWEKLNKITLAKEDKVLDLVSSENGSWGIPSRNGYPAADSEIRSFLLKLMDISTSQKVQVSASGLEKLGLNDSGKQSGLGTITLHYKDKEAGKVYLGALRSRKGESMENEMALTGQYVKYSAQDQVFMLPMAVNLKLEPKDWIDTNLLNVSANDIYEVVLHVVEPSADSKKNKNTSASIIFSREDDIFSVGEAKFKTDLNIPSGKQIQATNINQVTSALENFAISDVMSKNDDAYKSAEQEGKIEYKLLSGQVYEFKLAKKDQRFFVVVSARFDPALVEKIKALEAAYKPAVAKDASGSEGGSKKEEKASPAKKIEFAKEEDVNSANKKFQDWVYEVPEYLYGRLAKKGSELLTDVKVETPEGTNS